MNAVTEVPAAGWHIAQDGDYEQAVGLRTDFAICQCDRPDAAVHPQTRFVRTPTAQRPGAATIARYPGAHLVEREIAWSAWVAS